VAASQKHSTANIASAVPDSHPAVSPTAVRAGHSSEQVVRGTKKKRNANHANVPNTAKTKSAAAAAAATATAPAATAPSGKPKKKPKMNLVKVASFEHNASRSALMANHPGTSKGTRRKNNDLNFIMQAARMAGRQGGQAQTVQAAQIAERDLPKGVYKTSSGKYYTIAQQGARQRISDNFDTPEQAFAAGQGRLGQDLIRAQKAYAYSQGAAMADASTMAKQDLPTGVYKMPSTRTTSSRKFSSLIDWGGKTRYIGSFDTPEQASAAYVSVKNALDEAKLSAATAEGDDAPFYAAQRKAVEAEGGIILQSNTRSERSLPRGVKISVTGKACAARIWWDDTTRQIGTFYTPEQASIAYLSVKEDLAGVKPSAIGADKAKSLFDAAREKAKEAARKKGKEEAIAGVLV
jgi:L-lactate utilization protein LutC